MTPSTRVALAIAILLLIVSIRAVFVGYDSYTPVLFAEFYIGLFAIAMAFPSFVRTGDSVAGDHAILLLVAAASGAWLLGLAAPQIGEPNYCGGRYLLSYIVRVPTVYRCTVAPFMAAGFFAGWWIAIWTVEWWAGRLDFDSNAGGSQALGRVFIALGFALAAIAVYRLFVGSPRFKPILFAEIYLGLFALFLAVPSVLRSEQSPVEPDRYILYSAALVGAVVSWNLAPQIGEPGFCLPLPRSWSVIRDMGNDISRQVGVVPPSTALPKIFRCTTIPFAIAGGFAGWWIALWASERWKSPPENSEPA
ncbi:MAG: hypothetical protein ACJ79F_05200 [Gemmatimonadaceae bacterium]